MVSVILHLHRRCYFLSLSQPGMTKMTGQTVITGWLKHNQTQLQTGQLVNWWHTNKGLQVMIAICNWSLHL